MSEEKQIEEMAKDTCCIKNICPNFCNPSEHCTSVKFSKKAYNAGYRKASEVAREIIADMQKMLKAEAYPFPCAIGVEYAVPHCKIDQISAELKKKYTEEGK